MSKRAEVHFKKCVEQSTARVQIHPLVLSAGFFSLAFDKQFFIALIPNLARWGNTKGKISFLYLTSYK
jgi:hypothetical protein